ncbi:hypothetical protein JCM10212_002536 [Sporobolomyces blumeae]
MSIAVFPLLVEAGPDRTFTIRNNCDYPLWPAVTNYGTTSRQYTGTRGWQAEAGSEKEIKVPSPWNGRIWARRGCSFDSNGKGTCVTGNVDGGLEVDDQTIGFVNVGEFNLDSWGGNDFWDISCVPGWTVTMAVEPEPDECQSVICAADLNDSCPDDRMKQKDSDGNVIGCFSACMAGISAQDPSMNCCSGEYNSVDACKSEEVDFYDVLKPLCQNAYWYPYDFQPNTPTVDWACPSAKDAAYEITFCPDGETTKSDETIRAGGVTFVGDNASATGTEAGGTATGSATGSALGGKETGRGSSDDDPTTRDADEDVDASTSSTARSIERGAGSSSASPTRENGQSPSSGTATPSASSDLPSSWTGSAASSSSASDATILGFPQTPFLIACGTFGLVLLAIVLFVFCRSSHQTRVVSVAYRVSSRHVRRRRRYVGEGFSTNSASGDEDEDEDQDENEERTVSTHHAIRRSSGGFGDGDQPLLSTPPAKSRR